MEKNVNKTLYKLMLLILKYTPLTLAINDIIHSILAYYEIENYIFSGIAGVSLAYLFTLYILSYVFRFYGIYNPF